MGDARRRRMLLKPFPPVTVEPDQPGHRYHCYAIKRPVAEAGCGCDVYERLEARRTRPSSKAATLALVAAFLAGDL